MPHLRRSRALYRIDWPRASGAPTAALLVSQQGVIRNDRGLAHTGNRKALEKTPGDVTEKVTPLYRIGITGGSLLAEACGNRIRYQTGDPMESWRCPYI